MREIKCLTVVSYLNSALCNLKSNRHTQAKNDCESALRLEPTNIKAIFRKGEVRISLVKCRSYAKNIGCIMF
jgi:Tfp pilus assembly protein PilF